MTRYQVVPSTQFKRDLKLAQRRGLDIPRLTAVIKTLAAGEAPDWLLVYRYREEELLLYLVRTGSHSDLF